MSRLLVYLGGDHVGFLDRDPAGEMRFSYLLGAKAVSLSLPYREEPFEEGECSPFFEGVLPEEAQLAAIEQSTHVSDVVGLLDMLGGEVAGAVRLLREDKDTEPPKVGPIPAPLTDEQLGAVLDDLPKRPFMAGEGELRLSLAGAQSKLPVCLTGGQVRLPAPGEPTTHIIKPTITKFPGTTENEAFVMRLAAAVGLPVAPVEPRRLLASNGPKAYLLVERYDRVEVDGKVVRLHQEDFCQALGYRSRNKYESHLGPDIARCRKLIFDHGSKPAVDARTFLDAILFNLIVGNGDAHAKNYSLLYTRGGIRLAPLYDLLSTLYYPKIEPKMAMSIAGKFKFSEIDREQLAEGATSLKLARSYLQKRLDRFQDLLPAAAARVSAELQGRGLDDSVLERLERLVLDRLARLASV